MKKIIVTGGAGFIGSHIVDSLVDGINKVFVIDDLSSGSKENINQKAEFIKCDISTGEVQSIIKQIQPDIIVHLAAQMSVSESMKDPVKDVNINITGLINILSACPQDKMPYIVFSSTGGALYGEQDEFPAPETHPIRPTSVYGLSKFASEKYLELWQRVYGLKFGVVRFANVYGPRQNPHGEAGVVAIFSKLLLENKTPKIFGTGEFTRDYVYVADVVEAVNKLISREQSGVYNIGTGIETSVNKIYKKLLEVSGLDIEPIYAPQRAGDQTRSAISSEKAKKELGWYAKVEITQGLKETFEWFKKSKI